MDFGKGLRRRRIGEVRVVVADHVIRKGDHPLARKVDAASGNTAVLGIGHPAIGPMTMRIENGWKWSGASAQWPVQVAAQKQAGPDLEVNLLDAVAVSFHLPE